MNKEPLTPSGHRLGESHRKIIRAFARKWKLKEAEALRKIVEQAHVFCK